jgi:hypothetical protein
MPTPQSSRLQTEIDQQRSEIHSEQYLMSIGEIAHMYEAGELDIHPEFQRFYRWTDEQKSRFIESILLGIPIPSLFVAQREDGKWDVVDGLQRLSTIFQLMGILKDAKGNTEPALILTKTKYLPTLEGMQWAHGDSRKALTIAQQLYIKREKLDFKIILRESATQAKFELFQRLNTGGSELSDQEIRNAMLVAVNPPCFDWLKELASTPDFESCVGLSEQAYLQQYNLELVLRFVIFRTLQRSSLKGMGDIGDFITDKMEHLARNFKAVKPEEERAFKLTFALISDRAGEDAFRKYDATRRRFTRGFSISAFEVVALGVGYNIDSLVDTEPDLLTKIKSLWSDRNFRDSSGSGVRASTRLPNLLKIGRSLFRP